MHLASDYIHSTPRGGRCRIRVYSPDEEPDAVMVICTELANNPGTFSEARASADPFMLQFPSLLREEF